MYYIYYISILKPFKDVLDKNSFKNTFTKNI